MNRTDVCFIPVLGKMDLVAITVSYSFTLINETWDTKTKTELCFAN